ncbi:putative transcriptional regulatory protein pdtaR [Aquisphaera giovannonii]|uniref:Putative transcriptional regulatory protein pdtaR n=1 Tax=Aquisphaera giovannonii TaxID=406548 RepID=A0A5B9W893_9BACT|nr:response regulator [Aquisphaera giovannonii]QEH36852.1 putative transcriptional regulatory protein pdtaR [Aquisphaera giovannonii]
MPRSYRFVIADDEKSVAAGLQDQLEALGYDVVAVVNDGQRAVEMCRRALPDAVFMDIEMPGMDGLAAARQIAEDPGTPVIIITAHGHPNLIDQAVEDGVVSYLLKPMTNQGLHAAIEVAVARAREIQSLQENVDHLKMTLRERKLIERAKGILMSRRHLSENEAFRLLQRQSQDRRIPMAKLAESIIQTDELLEAPQGGAGVASPPPPRPVRRPASDFPDDE